MYPEFTITSYGHIMSQTTVHSLADTHRFNDKKTCKYNVIRVILLYMIFWLVYWGYMRFFAKLEKCGVFEGSDFICSGFLQIEK